VARAVQDATATKLRENADLLDALASTEQTD
jgi:hypothetical protein